MWQYVDFEIWLVFKCVVIVCYQEFLVEVWNVNDVLVVENNL